MGIKKRWKGKESQEAKRKERSREGGTWNNGVYVPYCISALLATIYICPHKNFLPPLASPLKKAGAATEWAGGFSSFWTGIPGGPAS